MNSFDDLLNETFTTKEILYVLQTIRASIYDKYDAYRRQMIKAWKGKTTEEERVQFIAKIEQYVNATEKNVFNTKNKRNKYSKDETDFETCTAMTWFILHSDFDFRATYYDLYRTIEGYIAQINMLDILCDSFVVGTKQEKKNQDEESGLSIKDWILN